ncbi:pentatricopeptide repeat-containing protein At5g46580, chloroplastic [Typha angustifolia]|uniref:pentatricopeptide repeat-containing protein At5g46580, chloroplastic n=1 Tax=Typha angustifolia TaxID=59011 RepID=UPI003C2F8921
MASLYTSTSTFFLHSPHPPPPLSSPKPTFFCRSSSSKQTANSVDQQPTTTANPSLSDQLLPLSLTLLKENPSKSQPLQAQPPKPKPTWVNPSKPKPTVLSLRRHQRRHFPSSSSSNPDLRRLVLIARKLRDSPDDDAEAFSAALQEAFPDPVSRDDALFVLNSLHSWQKSVQFFDWLKTQNSFSSETIFYNVVMKSLRFGRQWDFVERLACEMVERGIELDNITYSTVITTAKRCRRFDKAIEWFERMYRTGVMPDEVTYSAILDVYAQLRKREEVMSLYERARAGGWKPDAVAFAVLGKMFGEAGDYDGIQYVLQEMRKLDVKPNLVVYNTLLEAMGKVGKPGLARNLFEELVENGLSPNEKTLTALIKIYGKARWGRDALELWERMRENKWPMDFILYNTLLSMCADLGLEEEAEKLFGDMKQSEAGVRPDNWSYSAMINIYSSGGKAERALELFEEMLESRVEPNIMSYTCLIQCLGKSRRTDDAVRVFETALERGIKPDDRLCGCLLSVVALSKEGEMGMVLACLEKANSKLVKLVNMLADEKVSFDELKEELRKVLNESAMEVRRPFCNCLIDICRNQNFPSQRASELFQVGTLYGLYPGLHSKKTDEWSLNLRSLSVGAANTAFEEWMKSLCNSIQQKDDLPQSFCVHTGAGNHKFSKGLAGAFTAHLSKLAAPFHQDEEKSGSFVASKDELIPWLEAGIVPAFVAG